MLVQPYDPSAIEALAAANASSINKLRTDASADLKQLRSDTEAGLNHLRSEASTGLDQLRSDALMKSVFDPSAVAPQKLMWEGSATGVSMLWMPDNGGPGIYHIKYQGYNGDGTSGLRWTTLHVGATFYEYQNTCLAYKQKNNSSLFITVARFGHINMHFSIVKYEFVNGAYTGVTGENILEIRKS